MTAEPATLAAEMTGISKSFFGEFVLHSVDLDVRPGEVHAILGENGAGKSVLCSILAGLYRADSGAIEIAGERVELHSPHDGLAAGVGMVYQEFRLVDDLTVTENVVLGDPRNPGRINWTEARGRVAAAAEQHGIDTDPRAYVGDLTVGEQQRIEILKLLYREVDLLILDEPTAVLTPAEVRVLFETIEGLRRAGHGIVLISHKIKELRAIADRVTVMRLGHRVGTFDMDTVTDDELSELMVGKEVVTSEVPSRPSAGASPAFEVEDLTVLGDYGGVAVDSFAMTVHPGEIVGIAAIAGNGQHELAEALAGLRRAASGTIRLRISGELETLTDITTATVRERVEMGIAHIPEDRRHAGIAPGLGVPENLALKSYWHAPLSKRSIIARGAMQKLERALRDDYDIRGGSRKLPASVLSGGNIQKLILARELSRAPDLVIASYPTRGLDLGAVANVREILYRQLDDGSAIVLFSEDLDELFLMSHRLLVLFDGKVMAEFRHGDYNREVIGALMAGRSAEEQG
ncbi:MAG: ABC transporter ATP-binding protein [Acidimicrobiia bacterium]|nr:ABC transporter ATP-binding protein [Acidimicrobiia bacterium]